MSTNLLWFLVIQPPIRTKLFAVMEFRAAAIPWLLKTKFDRNRKEVDQGSCNTMDDQNKT